MPEAGRCSSACVAHPSFSCCHQEGLKGSSATAQLSAFPHSTKDVLRSARHHRILQALPESQRCRGCAPKAAVQELCPISPSEATWRGQDVGHDPGVRQPDVLGRAGLCPATAAVSTEQPWWECHALPGPGSPTANQGPAVFNELHQADIMVKLRQLWMGMIKWKLSLTKGNSCCRFPALTLN